MTEFGKSPLLDGAQLEALGYNIAIYPMTAMRLALKAVAEGLGRIKRDGGQAALLDPMWTRNRLYQTLGYALYNHFDQDIHNFHLDKEN